MTMSSPSKKAYTDSTHSEHAASNSAPSTLGAGHDDLLARLQNIGSRVRMNVSTGYLTSPTSSPSKQPPLPTAPPSTPELFTTSNAVFATVFPSGSGSHIPSPSPSPKKRSRRLWQQQQEESDDEDDVMFITDSPAARMVKQLPRRHSAECGSVESSDSMDLDPIFK